MPPKRKRGATTVKAASSKANSIKAGDGDGDDDDDNAADDDTNDAGVGGPKKKKKIKIKNDEQNQQPMTTTTTTNADDETTTKTETFTPPPPPKTCPYLSFVNRPLLDFDFEKRCSVSFAKENCYCCLTCGHFFAGRGPKTPAYTHALERENHFVFMHLENGRAFCLPENYEIFDASLEDVRKVLFPRFTSEEIARLEKEAIWSKALDGTEYLVGVVGLNRVENAKGVNSIVQSLSRVEKLRAHFLSASLINNNNKNENDTLQSLCQRIWNKHNFRGQPVQIRS